MIPQKEFWEESTGVQMKEGIVICSATFFSSNHVREIAWNFIVRISEFI